MKIKFQFKSPLSLLIVLGLFCIVALSMQNPNSEKIQITIKSNQNVLLTESIQKAIDSCAESGGGVVVFSGGTYLCGGIQLKSNVTLQLDKSAILQGSDNYTDYKNDAFIFGKDLTNISILGKGIIDGVDCKYAQGEEGFRGAHCIRLVNCKNISFKDFTIKNSANWAFNLRYCSFGNVERVSIRGGHDGFHTRFCNNFTVTGCDFRTGDDAFAGNDNQDFLITDCKINTSCNGFRMGCLNLRVKRCQFWGPGEAFHKIQNRNNMLSAFVHFSPTDENPKIQSGNWQIEDCTIDNVDHVYVYNYLDGLWQTGQPVTSVQFENIKATGILAAFNIIGDSTLKFDLCVKNSSFGFREGAVYKGDKFEDAKLLSSSLFNANNFDRIMLQNVSLSKLGITPIFNCKLGNRLSLKRVNFTNGDNMVPYSIDKIKEIQMVKIKHNNKLIK